MGIGRQDSTDSNSLTGPHIELFTLSWTNWPCAQLYEYGLGIVKDQVQDSRHQKKKHDSSRCDVGKVES